MKKMMVIGLMAMALAGCHKDRPPQNPGMPFPALKAGFVYIDSDRVLVPGATAENLVNLWVCYLKASALDCEFATPAQEQVVNDRVYLVGCKSGGATMAEYNESV